jgi:predicted ester cyclase
LTSKKAKIKSSMNQAKRNKDFIIGYLNSVSGVVKTRAMCERYITDESLTEHILFFDACFPKYEVIMDEISGDGNRVIVRARMKGKHEGEFNGIPATHKEVFFPFVVGYEIENNKIVSHWLLADQMMLMEQLGVIAPVAQ